MEKYFGKKDGSNSTAGTKESRIEPKRPRIELNMDEIVADPGLRKQIDEFHPDIRDDARRAYLEKGPCRPTGHKFPRTWFGQQSRGFVPSWFGEFDWFGEKMVKSDRHTHFALVYRLIELALILPVATATVERAFSAMNIIKTERRNKMNDDWMNNSMICYIERELFASIEDEKILKRFQGIRTRMMHLPREAPSINRGGPSVAS